MSGFHLGSGKKKEKGKNPTRKKNNKKKKGKQNQTTHKTPEPCKHCISVQHWIPALSCAGI